MPIPAPAFFAKMNETQRLITSITTIVVVGGALVTYWALGLKEAHALSGDVGTAEASLKAAQKTLDDFPDLQRRHRESLSETRRISQLLPDQPALDRAFAILEAIEQQAGKTTGDPDFTLLAGKTVSKPVTGKSTLPKDVEELTVELQAVGSWSGLTSFLDGVEHADRLMVVKNFKTTGADKKAPTLMSYKIVLGIYVMRPSAAGAKK